MDPKVNILIADDDFGHVTLLKKNLVRSGINNHIEVFNDGKEILDFLFCNSPASCRETNSKYVLILDIRMPKTNGIEALEIIKKDEALKKLPVIMMTTTENPNEINQCYSLGCSNYIVKPVDYNDFTDTVKSLGHFLSVMKYPVIFES